MPLFDKLDPRPADALLGLMAAFRADPRDDKVDLGVGIYRTEDGSTPVMAAVRAAEGVLVERQETKAYEGPQGNTDFTTYITEALKGGSTDGLTVSFAAPGGCGALFLGLSLAKRRDANATAWVSDPTWPNHLHIARSVGLKTRSYAYAASADPGVDTERMLATLAEAVEGDVIVIQGPCHNPTGIDLTDDAMAKVGTFCRERKLLPLVDVAYHGFANSLDTDLIGVQRLLATCPDALVAYSCSKNFGLYRDRAGAFLAQTDSAKASDAVRTHIADIARAAYSMPPAHGPAIVATILGDSQLKAQWIAELVSMQKRMQGLREQLATALSPRSNSYDPDVLTAQRGMFSQLPFQTGGVEALREQGIYIPGSGRINVAGLTEKVIPDLAAKLSLYL